MSDSLNPSAAEAMAAAGRPVLLREAREAAGLHIAALAAALKVPVKKLEALEAGRYDELPDMTFARALASSACRQLKIDPATVLQQIPAAHTPPLGDSPQAINAPYKGAADPAPLNAMGWLSRPAVLAAIALLLGALVLVFLPGRDSASPAEVVVPPAGVVPGAPGEATEPAQPVAAAEPLVAASATGAATVTDMATPAVAPDPVVVPPVTVATDASATAAVSAGVPADRPTNASASAGGSLLTITATGESWVEVVNGSGSVVMQRVLKAGDVIDFSTAPPYAVVLGRADAAVVTVRGQPFDTTPFVRNSVARFEVK